MRRISIAGLVLLFSMALASTVSAAEFVDADRNTYHGTADPASVPLMEATDLTPLGDPSGLRWDSYRHGDTLWETLGDFQRRVKVKIYRVGKTDEPVCDVTCSYHGITSTTHDFHDNRFRYDSDHLPSGDYYFTVQNLGDGITCSDSAVVSSLDSDGGVYHYEAPEPRLEPAGQGYWQWPAHCWEDKQQTDPKIMTYQIEYGYSKAPATDETEVEYIGGNLLGRSGERSSWLEERLIGEHGAGWYYFRVRPISSDIEQQRHGEWSPWSEGYNLLEASRKITDSLNAIGENAASEEQIRQQVQELNQVELENALTADILGAETGTAEALAKLEEAVGGPAVPSVTDDTLAEVFDEKKVSIVGAALNNVTETPGLKISRPQSDHDVREEMYNATLAVSFSMTLENVQNQEALAVPVKVTLPIPETINPDVVAILHYRYDGICEEVERNVYEQEGQWYVSFVLTSFSDFTLTERVTESAGPSITVQPGGAYQTVQDQEGSKLLLARYDSAGRLLSAEILADHSGTLARSGKLFLLDGKTFQPLCRSTDITV